MRNQKHHTLPALAVNVLSGTDAARERLCIKKCELLQVHIKSVKSYQILQGNTVIQSLHFMNASGDP